MGGTMLAIIAFGVTPAAIGVAAGRYCKPPISILVGALGGWLGLLAWFLLAEFTSLPNPGGGACMWPIALFFGSPVAAAIGALGAIVTVVVLIDEMGAEWDVDE
jgi:hypothetical protein